MNKYEITKRAIIERDKKLMEQRNYHSGLVQEIDAEMTSNKNVIELINVEIKREEDRNTALKSGIGSMRSYVSGDPNAVIGIANTSNNTIASDKGM